MMKVIIILYQTNLKGLPGTGTNGTRLSGRVKKDISENHVENLTTCYNGKRTYHCSDPADEVALLYQLLSY